MSLVVVFLGSFRLDFAHHCNCLLYDERTSSSPRIFTKSTFVRHYTSMREKTTGISLKFGRLAIFSGSLAWVLSTPLLKLQKDNMCWRFTMPTPRHGQPMIGQDINKQQVYTEIENSDYWIGNHNA